MGAVRLLAAVLLLTSGAREAAEDRPLREVRSANQRFVLRIEPGRPGSKGRNCQAALYEQQGPGRGRERVWQRALVNDVAPVQAFIRDDGRFVVTLDEFRRGGARHALVVYGRSGELLRHFVLTDLLGPGDWPQVRTESLDGRDGRIVWLEGAEATFDPSGATFTIRLAWGQRIDIDLKKLCVVRGASGGSPTTAPSVPAEIAALLRVDEDEPANPLEQIGNLVELTDAQEAQTAAIVAELVGAPGPTTAPAQGGGWAASVPSPEPASSAPIAAEAAKSHDERVAASSTAYLAGRLVPTPDPANKVDYVEWLNTVGRVDGPDAAPLYAAAAELFVPWDGDAELLAAAQRGEPEALFAPPIQAWLEANAAALRAFREAAGLPVRSSRYAPEARSVMDIPLPEIAAFCSLAKLNCLEGRRLAALGRTDEAVTRFLEVIAAGGHYGRSLTLVENLVGQAARAIGSDNLLEVLAGPAADKLDYQSLVGRVEAACQPLRPLAEVLESERISYLDAAQRCWDADPVSGELRFNEQAADGFLALLVDTDADRQVLLRRLAADGYRQTVDVVNACFDALTVALRLPYAEARPHIEQIETLLDSQAINPLLRGMVAPVPYARMAVRVESQRRATVLVTRLKAYRQLQGQYPAALAELGEDEFAIDPFSGRQFVYQRVGNDFRLYSVGANLVDDGGVHDRRGVQADLCFWPPPAR